MTGPLAITDWRPTSDPFYQSLVGSITSWQNPVLYGADPTGVGDSTGAFQTALDKIDALGGGTLLVPYGVFSITQIRPSTSTSIRGCGTGSVLKLRSGTNGIMIRTRNTLASPSTYAHDVTICDLQFDLNSSNNTTTARAIEAYFMRNLIIERCRFLNWNGDCVRVFGDTNLSIQARIMNNQFDNTNGINTAGSGILLDSGTFDSLLWANDVGNTFRGIVISNGTNGHHKLMGNWCWGAVDLGLFVYQSHVLQIDCQTVESNFKIGARFDGCQHVKWTNGRAMHNGKLTANTYPNLEALNGTTLSVMGAMLGDDFGAGATAQYGVHADGAGTIVNLDDCDNFGNLTGPTSATNGGVINTLIIP